MVLFVSTVIIFKIYLLSHHHIFVLKICLLFTFVAVIFKSEVHFRLDICMNANNMNPFIIRLLCILNANKVYPSEVIIQTRPLYELKIDHAHNVSPNSNISTEDFEENRNFKGRGVAIYMRQIVGGAYLLSDFFRSLT